MGEAVGNALLRIGAKFEGATDINFAISMMRQMVGALAELVKSGDEYVEMMERTNVAAVDFAKRMTKSQIETRGLVESFNSLKISGNELSKDNFALLSKAAVEMSDALGTDAKQSLDELTNAFIRGNQRGLKPFGIVIDENNKKVDVHTQILDQLRQKFGDVEIKADTATDKVVAMKNSLGDFFSEIYRGISKTQTPIGSFFDFMTDKINDVTSALRSLNKAQSDYLWSTEYLYDVITAISSYASSEDAATAKLNILGFLTGGKLGQGSFGKTKEEQWKEEGPLDFFGPSPESLLEKKKAGGMSAAKSSGKTQEQIDQENFDAWMKESMSGSRVDVSPNIFGPQTQTMDFTYEMGGLPGGAETYSTEASRAASEQRRNDIQAEMDLMGEQYDMEEALAKQRQEWVEQRENADANTRKNLMIQQVQEEMYYNSTEYHLERMGEVLDGISTMWGAVKNAFEMCYDAYINGTEKMSKAQAVMFYINAIIEAALAVARATKAFIAKDYMTGAGEIATAAAFTAAAVLAASHGGASGGSVVSSGGASAAATTGRYTGGYNEGQQIDTVKFEITLDDTSKLLGWILKENQRSYRAGSRHFQEAS